MKVGFDHNPIGPPLIKGFLQDVRNNRRGNGREKKMITDPLLRRGLKAAEQPPAGCKGADHMFIGRPSYRLR
jgi:hypothetical protein